MRSLRESTASGSQQNPGCILGATVKREHTHWLGLSGVSASEEENSRRQLIHFLPRVVGA
jgi:hypothetical protein